MRRLLICAIVAAVATPALAQGQQKTYKLELSEQMLNVIAGALAKQPYGEVAPVINELQKQLSAQPAPEPAKSEEKDKK